MSKGQVDNFMGSVEKEYVRRFTKAGVYFTSKTRGYLNVSQPYKRSKSGKHRGLDPSKPGEFPKKLSGQLHWSIIWDLDQKKMILTVGSNLKPYPKFLQISTRFMRARPWLTLSWGK